MDVSLRPGVRRSACVFCRTGPVNGLFQKTACYSEEGAQEHMRWMKGSGSLGSEEL